jgi:hypothetical protein
VFLLLYSNFFLGRLFREEKKDFDNEKGSSRDTCLNLGLKIERHCSGSPTKRR